MKEEASTVPLLMNTITHYYTLLHKVDGKNMPKTSLRYKGVKTSYQSMSDILFSKHSQRSKTMVDAENDEFKTPLHLAVETGNVE